MQQLPDLQGKTVVLIDVRYFNFLVSQERFGKRVDYRMFCDLICNDSEMSQAYFYDCITPNSERFFEAVSRIPGFTCRSGSIKVTPDGMEQKGVDVLIALDFAEISMCCPDLTNIILISGDADFEPAVQFARRHGKKVYAVGAQRPGTSAQISRKLETAVDGVIRIGVEFLEKAVLNYSAPAVLTTLSLPVPGIILLPRYWRKIEAGEVAEARKGSEAICKSGGTVIARPGSKVHALKGATIYLFPDVEFTGTDGYKLIRCVMNAGKVQLSDSPAA
ncbi:MAG TPA: NYN domain-containing protein [Trichormus sp.]|jgi:uncharacterized LabA/DUF88 family protein